MTLKTLDEVLGFWYAAYGEDLPDRAPLAMQQGYVKGKEFKKELDDLRDGSGCGGDNASEGEPIPPGQLSSHNKH